MSSDFVGDSNSTSTTSAADCPICLCPIPSEPWGVCNPCGHAFHRGCWDQLVANHHPGRRRNARPPCAICKVATRGFVPVFLDLGGDIEAGVDTASGSEGEGVIEVDDDALDEMMEEWSRLWRELEKLCGCDGEKPRGEIEGDGRGAIDMTNNSDRCIANICATIDLTQRTPPKQKARSTPSMEAPPDKQSQQFHQNRSKVSEIIQRLSHLHMKLLNRINPQATPNNSLPVTVTNRQVQRLKSKVFRLQSTNADLTNRLGSLESTNESLTMQVDQIQQTALDRTAEAERAKRRYENLHAEHVAMEESYHKHVTKSTLDKKSLQQSIAKLQGQCAKLSNRAGVEETQELQDIRARYSRMAQTLHDAKSTIARLEEDIERRWRGREPRSGGDQVRGRRDRTEISLGVRPLGDGHARCALSTEDQFDGVDDGLGLTTVHSRVACCQTSTGQNQAKSIHAGIGKDVVTKFEGKGQPALSHGKNGLNSQQKSRAMEALDRAPARKHLVLLREHQRRHPKRRRGFTNSHDEDGCLSGNENGAREKVHLMMRTDPSKQRPYGNISGIRNKQNMDTTATKENCSHELARGKRKGPTDPASLSSEPPKTPNAVSVSMRQRSNIASFFKPSEF